MNHTPSLELFADLMPPQSGQRGSLSEAPGWAQSDLAKLPVLSIRQPWAWLILNAGKDIENRCWPTKFRGRFLIHAAKGCTKTEYEDALWFAGDFEQRTVAATHLPGSPAVRVPEIKDLPRGGIVGVAEIVDCVDESESDWFVGEYGFVLRNVEPLEFLPVTGALGFFRLPNDNSPSVGATGNDHE